MHSIAAYALLLAAVAAEQPKPKPGAAEQGAPGTEMVCRRFTETGSLVKTYRVCKSKADWQRERDNIRGGTRSTGCQTTSLNGPC